MSKRLKIPKYAKSESLKGLNVRSKLSVSNKEQRKRGILSGLNYATKLKNNKFLDERDFRAIGKFYKVNSKRKKYELAIQLRGGVRFGKLLSKICF